MIDAGFEGALAKIKVPVRRISMLANFHQGGIPRVKIGAERFSVQCDRRVGRMSET
jgi:hypothetical protein